MSQPYLIAKFLPNILKQSTEVSYKFMILQDGIMSPRYSTHMLMLNGVESFFSVTANGWIYLFTDNEYLPMDDAWKGDHYTLGYTKYELNSDDNPDDVIMLHKTMYTYNPTTGYYMRKVVYCNINADVYRKSGNPLCFFVSKTRVSAMNFSFDEAYNYDTNLKAFLQVGLTQDAPIKHGGKIQYKSKTRKVHIGVRGGKYVIVDNKKVYIKEQRATSPAALPGGGFVPSDEDIKNYVESQLIKRGKNIKVFVVVDEQERRIRFICDSEKTSIRTAPITFQEIIDYAKTVLTATNSRRLIRNQ